MSKLKLGRTFAIVSAWSAVASAGCTEAPSAAGLTPRVALIDRTTTGPMKVVPEWANGTYGAGCRDPGTGVSHRATDAWSLRIGGDAAMTHPPLFVSSADVGCTLTLDAIGTASAVYRAAPPFPLTTSYQPNASAFSAGDGTVAFYANAKLGTIDVGPDFVLSLAYSDEPTCVDAASMAGDSIPFAGASAAGLVAAPQYTARNTVAIETTEDGTVVGTTGSFTLTLDTQAGDSYRVIASGIDRVLTFAKVDAAYKADGGGAPAVPIDGSPIAIASSTLLADAVTLPTRRTLVVRREVDGVPAYQVFRLAFKPPPAP
jgi:hypothetical protein